MKFFEILPPGRLFFGICSVLLGLLGCWLYVSGVSLTNEARSMAVKALTNYNSRIKLGTSHGARADRCIDEIAAKATGGELLEHWKLGSSRHLFPYPQSKADFEFIVVGGRRIRGGLHFMGSGIYLVDVNSDSAAATEGGQRR